MKKQYICPKSEVIYIECGSPLLNTSETLPDSKMQLDYETETEEQW